MSRKIFLLSINSLLLLCVCLLTISCDGKLSRSEAAKLISENQKFSDPLKAEFRYGEVFARGAFENFANLNFANHFMLPPNCHIYSILASLEYIEIEKGPGVDNVSLTSKGQKEAANWKKSSGITGEYYSIPITEREMIEVTGVTETKSSENSAQVIFNWRWRPLNEVGKTLMESGKNPWQTFEGKAVLQKFDDGWRVTNVSGPGISLW